MKLFFSSSLCKKCPLGDFDPCYYKEAVAGRVRKIRSRLNAIHKCQHYRKLFKRGQFVLIALSHQLKRPDGKWDWVSAGNPVPGRVLYNRGSKFVIEVLEPALLIRKKGGKPGVEKFRPLQQFSLPAREIRPLLMTWQALRHMKELKPGVRAGELAVN